MIRGRPKDAHVPLRPPYRREWTTQAAEDDEAGPHRPSQIGVSRDRIDIRLGIEAIHPRPGRRSGAAPGEETGEFGVDRHTRTS